MNTERQHKRWLWLVAVALIAVVVLLVVNRKPAPAPVLRLPVRIGIPQQLPSSLMMIAQQQGFFAAEGLDVELHRYPSGTRALSEGLLSGAVDYVSAADFSFVSHVFAQPELTAISCISLNTNSFRILARRDRGVAKLSDLQGKTIALQANSATQYFLHGVQEVERIDKLHTVYAPIEQLGSGLLVGKYDAISIREPYLQQIAQQLGDNAVILAEPGSYVQHELLLTRRSALRARPVVADRMLRALLAAEAFVAAHPQQAAAVVSRFMAMPNAGTLPGAELAIEYELSLPQALLFMLDAQAQWMRAEGLVQAPAPDFFKHIDTTAFKRVLPVRATLIE